jgi:type III restriction enzyme
MQRATNFQKWRASGNRPQFSDWVWQNNYDRSVARVAIFEGDDEYPAQPQARVLWISDSPELNIQSRDKLLKACDTPDYDHLEVISSETFDEEFLRAGVVYFINTQLLGKDKLLTQEGGDRRRFTFWQTIANTVRDYGNDFLLIIDEAHRGMGVSSRERQARTTTVRKFIEGSDADGMPPAPLVLGMSATTQRFDTVLGEKRRGTTRKTIISAEEVRSSGLLKDQMVVSCASGRSEHRHDVA